MPVQPVQNQSWQLYQGSDRTLRLTYTTTDDPTLWSLSFQVSTRPGRVNVFTVTTGFTITASGSGYLIDVPLTRAHTSLLTPSPGTFFADLWRTDSGLYERLAGGTLTSLAAEYPPA